MASAIGGSLLGGAASSAVGGGLTGALISGGVSAATNLIGSSRASSSAERGASNAAAAQLQATREGLQAQREMFDLSRADLAPWRQAGGAALGEQMRRMGFAPTGGGDSTTGASGSPAGGGFAPGTGPENFAPGDTPSSGNDFFGAGSPEQALRNGWYDDDVARELAPKIGFDPAEIGSTPDGPPEAGFEYIGGAAPPLATTGATGTADDSAGEFIEPLVFDPGEEFTTPSPFVPDEEFTTPLEFDPGEEFETPLVFDPGEEFTDPITREDVQLDPGYQFRLEEGEKALERRQTAGGISLSGRGIKEFQRYGQGLASEEYGNAYGRTFADLGRRYGIEVDEFQSQVGDRAQRYGVAADKFQSQVGDRAARYGVTVDEYNAQQADLRRRYGVSADTFNSQIADRDVRFNRLASIAGVGQSATNVTAGLGGQVGSNALQAYGNQGANLANIYSGLGNNQANIAMGTAQGLNQAFQGTAQNYYAYQQQQQQNQFNNRLLDMVYNQGGIAGTSGGNPPIYGF